MVTPRPCFSMVGLREVRVAPILVLKYNIRTRSLADQGAIEDVLAVEDDVVPFDRADVLEQGCVTGIVKLTGFRGTMPPYRVFRHWLAAHILGLSQLVMR